MQRPQTLRFGRSREAGQTRRDDAPTGRGQCVKEGMVAWVAEHPVQVGDGFAHAELDQADMTVSVLQRCGSEAAHEPLRWRTLRPTWFCIGFGHHLSSYSSSKRSCTSGMTLVAYSSVL